MFDIIVKNSIIEHCEKQIDNYNFGQRYTANGNKEQQLTGIIGQCVVMELFQLNHINGNDGFDNGIDIVYTNNYIEHLIDPFNDLKKVIDLLKDDGKLVIISQCWEYCIDITHYHTFYFLGKSLNYLCNELNINEIYSDKIFFTDNEDNEWSIIKIFEKKSI